MNNNKLFFVLILLLVVIFATYFYKTKETFQSVEYNFDMMTEIYMCFDCAKNETCGENVLDTFNYELFGRDYIDCDKNIYNSLGIYIIQNKNNM